MMKAIELTSTSWLLTIRQGNVGLMRLNDGIYTILGEEYNGIYNNLNDFKMKYNININFEKIAEDNTEKSIVGGFPTKHNDIFDVIIEKIPSYSKRAGSSDRYAAGYYSVNFEKCCHSTFCPRVSTLDTHEWSGPFKTKLEVKHAVKLMSEK